MTGIICKQCGYENTQGSSICEICAEMLEQEQQEIESPAQQQIIQQQSMQQSIQEPIKQPMQQPIQQSAQQAEVEYYIQCPESQTKTVLTSACVTKFFCEGCKREHEIDGFLWVVEKRDLTHNAAMITVDTSREVASTTNSNYLWLEEVNCHTRIEIDQVGGTLGRYGKYGAEFFQSRELLMVSGEHCRITYEFGNWVLRHISRTNETKYNQMILGSNEPYLLEDGNILTLANAVSFVVRIG